MGDLPKQGKLSVPIDWTTDTQKTSINAAGYYPTITMGWRSWSDVATLQWVSLTAADQKALLDEFRSTTFNGVYDYNCLVNGPIRVQLTGSCTFNEARPPYLGTVSVSVRRVS